MNMKIGLVALAVTTALASCAAMAVTNDAITQRTSFALGMQPSQFTISNRTDSGTRTDYKVVTSAGKHYSCYVTSILAVTGQVVSDAMCVQMKADNSTPSSVEESKSAKECNALLKAAGKCD